MTTPLNNRMEDAVAELRESQAQIKKMSAEMAETSVTEVSKDRIVEATCDAQGQLTGLKLNGKSYRTMPPAELCSKILETVHAAQAAAAQKSAELFNQIMNDGPMQLGGLLGGISGGLGDMFGGGPGGGGFDLDKMVGEALKMAEMPMLPAEMETGRPIDGSRPQPPRREARDE